MSVREIILTPLAICAAFILIVALLILAIFSHDARIVLAHVDEAFPE